MKTNWKLEAKNAERRAVGALALYWLLLIGGFSILTGSFVLGTFAFICFELARNVFSVYKEQWHQAELFDGHAKAEEAFNKK